MEAINHYFFALGDFCMNHAFAISIAVFVLFLLLILIKIQRHLGRQIPITCSEFGCVAASFGAIREVMRATCETILPQSHPIIRVVLRNNNVRLRIKIKAITGVNVQELSKKIQQAAIENLRDQFGFQTIGCVDVIITGFRRIKSHQSLNNKNMSDSIPTNHINGGR